jgi:hypothetical protein
MSQTISKSIVSSIREMIEIGELEEEEEKNLEIEDTPGLK